MLFIARCIIVIIYTVTICTFGLVYCLFNFRNPNHVATFGRMFGYLAPIFGLKVEIRKPNGAKNFGNAIYIANHQNNYDMVIASNIIQPSTITVGKKNLIWIPFFGQLYWLTGNILIDRDDSVKSRNTIAKIIDQFKKHNISVWIFPEGTRSKGKGLLPFKTGAFYAAIIAGVPIIPICISNTFNKVNLNRLHNGLVIVEMLPPIDVSRYKKNQVRELTTYCRELMIQKINMLNKEVIEREINKEI